MSKKNKKNKVKIVTTTSDNEVTRIIKILVVVLIVLGITYLIAALITGDIKLGSKNNTEEEVAAEIQYEEILAGKTLNYSDSDYYVMYFNFTDNISSSYITFKDIYAQKEDALNFYLVDLEKGFNKSFVKEENEEYEEYPDKIENLKVTNPTILKISNHKVVERVEGKTEVINYLTEITK